MRPIENHTPLVLGFYQHKTPYNKRTVAKLLPELEILEPGQSFLIPIEEAKMRAACSKAIAAAIPAAQFEDLLSDQKSWKTATRHEEGGVRIWRIK